MPLSSSVHSATRQRRTFHVDAPARGIVSWTLIRDLMSHSGRRIADVNVRTGADALSEVHSRLLFRSPSFARRVPEVVAVQFL